MNRKNRLKEKISVSIRKKGGKKKFIKKKRVNLRNYNEGCNNNEEASINIGNQSLMRKGSNLDLRGGGRGKGGEEREREREERKSWE